jgi:hypothetical protein
MQSPGGADRRVDRGEMDAAALLDMGSPDYHSGRSSPAVGSGSFGASPARAQPVLRPRGNSVETRGGPLGAPSSQPTPASTPAPGTPSLRGASLPIPPCSRRQHCLQERSRTADPAAVASHSPDIASADFHALELPSLAVS